MLIWITAMSMRKMLRTFHSKFMPSRRCWWQFSLFRGKSLRGLQRFTNIFDRIYRVYLSIYLLTSYFDLNLFIHLYTKLTYTLSNQCIKYYRRFRLLFRDSDRVLWWISTTRRKWDKLRIPQWCSRHRSLLEREVSMYMFVYVCMNVCISIHMWYSIYQDILRLMCLFILLLIFVSLTTSDDGHSRRRRYDGSHEFVQTKTKSRSILVSIHTLVITDTHNYINK